MADIRFNISGSSAPFVAEICRFGTNTITKQIVVDYSGNTSFPQTVCGNQFPINIFSNLSPNTQYVVNVRDMIGNTVCCNYTTPAPVATTTLATKQISMLGTITSPVSGVAILDGGLLSISPTLSQGESFNLCFSGKTIGGALNGTQSNVSISCKASGTSNWVSKATYTDTNNNFEVPAITVNAGDSICYQAASYCLGGHVGNYTGCALLCIKSVTPNGFNATFGTRFKDVSLNFTTTTTTTNNSTTLSPIVISIDNILNTSTNGECSLISGNIVTTPPLTEGQSFRLYYSTKAHSETFESIPKPIYACAWLYKPTTNYNCAESRVLGSPTAENFVSDSNKPNAYIDVNSTNINSIVLCVVTRSAQSNNLADHLNCANLVLDNITNTVGGNFTLTPNQCLFAISPSQRFPGDASAEYGAQY